MAWVNKTRLSSPTGGVKPVEPPRSPRRTIQRYREDSHDHTRQDIDLEPSQGLPELEKLSPNSNGK